MQSDKIIEKISNKLRESDPANRTVTSVFQFHFTDLKGQLVKDMVFDFKNLNIYEGTFCEPDVQITISDENFYLVGSKQTTFDKLLSENKVNIEGDREAFNKMAEKIRLSSKNE